MQDASTPPEPASSRPIATADQFGIREGLPADIPFVFRAWLTSYRRSPFARGIRDRVYFAHQHRLIEAILKRGRVRVAHTLEDSDTILGFLVLSTTPNALHYAFTKPAFRRMHIMTALIPPGEWTYSHRTDDSDRCIAKLPLLTYNPYQAFGGLRDG
jgi:hypothetical protein